MKKKFFIDLTLILCCLIGTLFLVARHRSAPPHYDETDSSGGSKKARDSSDKKEVSSRVSKAEGAEHGNSQNSITVEFSKERYQNDPAFRELVNLYFLRQDFTNSPALSSREGLMVLDYLLKAGFPESVARRFQRHAVEDVLTYQWLNERAQGMEEAKQKAMASLPKNVNLSPEQLAAYRQTKIDMYESGKESWNKDAETFKLTSIENLKQSSGITNAEFFEMLYSLSFSNLSVSPLPSASYFYDGFKMTITSK